MTLRRSVLGFLVPVSLTAQISIAPMADSLKAHISVLTYGSAEYDKALRNLVPAASLSSLSLMLPYSVIVQNTSEEPLMGINVVFWKEGFDGKTLPYSFLSWNMDPAVPPVLAAKGYQFFSPSQPVNRAILQAHPIEKVSRSVSLGQIATDLSRERRITFSVDAIITSRGAFLGPDALLRYDQIQAEERAKAWLAARLSALSGSASAQIAEMESLAAKQIPRSGNPFQLDAYNLRLQQDGKFVSKLMKAGWSNAASDYVSRVASSLW
jgi:hypothetical protein